MLQKVFPTIIRGSKLHMQRQAFVVTLLLPAASLVGMELVNHFQQQVAVMI